MSVQNCTAKTLAWLLVAGMSCAMQLTAWAQDPAPQWSSFAIYPSEIRISSQSDAQHLVAVATRADGITVDVSDQVAWRIENPALAKIENLIVYPVADGATELVGAWNGIESRIKLTLAQSTVPRTVGFERDVMPILTKSGCNTGSCHGAARGKDGFRLSLFGFDPLGDYQRITREIGIRRINLAVPEQSLILLKATGSVQHTGGKKIELTTRTWATDNKVTLPKEFGN